MKSSSWHRVTGGSHPRSLASKAECCKQEVSLLERDLKGWQLFQEACHFPFDSLPLDSVPREGTTVSSKPLTVEA